jgi:hypothetical protein
MGSHVANPTTFSLIYCCVWQNQLIYYYYTHNGMDHIKKQQLFAENSIDQLMSCNWAAYILRHWY